MKKCLVISKIKNMKRLYLTSEWYYIKKKHVSENLEGKKEPLYTLRNISLV